MSSIAKVGLTIDKLVGQCYDGASNMCGAIAGVQAKVKALQPKAIYIMKYTHCYAHCTNLILVEATSSNQYSRNFFGVLQNLYTFLEASPHRHAMLAAVIIQVTSKSRVKLMKKLSDTHWACRIDAILAIYENYAAISVALDEIQDNSSNGHVSSEACGLRHQMLKFEFLICLVVLKDLLCKCQTISSCLQKEDIDIVSALQVVDSTVKTLQSMRNEAIFKKFYNEASRLAEELDIEVAVSRPRKVSWRLDDNPDNQCFLTSNEKSSK